MHDTALRIGGLAIEIYSGYSHAKILDFGSYDVNGTLRQFAPKGSEYIGIDIAEGPGVDLVVAPGEPVPFEEGTFDLVIASSMLEHDPAFWQTFVEMCRKTRSGGFVYINAPSNGTFHRYPEDHWRFYPDCGKALVRWAVSQGVAIELVESFTAERESDVWNDFAAVFRRLPANEALPKRMLYREVRCRNIIVADGPDLIAPRSETEDMVLITEAHEAREQMYARDYALSARVQEVEDQALRLSRQCEALEGRVSDLQQRLAQAAQAEEMLTMTARQIGEIGALLSEPQPRWWSLLPKQLRQGRVIQSIEKGGLFNALTYLARYEDIKTDRLGALKHYLRHGWAESRKWY